ncbi:taste receptor type 2 member 39-like [Rhinoderma darwinii]|uniref:taste receptor type 2 member 39-like n=1 Tax=Rhinoderma darwinii TaxID=43563 RepID=UPI003F67542F
MESNNMNIVAPVITLILEIVIGLFSNTFIVSVIFYDFHKQKYMSSSNKILVCLGLSNVRYGLLISAGLLDEFIGLGATSTFYVSSMYIIFLLYSISSCAWLTAGLSAFYFIKVSQARFVSWVKFRISHIAPWMLVVLEVVSLISGFFSSLLLISPRSSSRNITDSPPSLMMGLKDNMSGLINAALALISVPFMIEQISTTCIVWTLKRHSQKMERRIETVDNGRLTSYEQVVGRMTHFMLFYGIFYTLTLVLYFAIIAQLQSGFWVTLLFLSSFNLVQSVLLILGNPRLREAWKEMSHYQTFTRLLCGSNNG